MKKSIRPDFSSPLAPANESLDIFSQFASFSDKPMSTSEKLTKSEQLNCTFDEIYQLLKDNVLMRCQTPQSRIGPEKLQLLHNVLTYLDKSIMLRYLYSMLILGFIVPLCIICFCYGMIITKVRKTEINARHNIFRPGLTNKNIFEPDAELSFNS